MRRILLVCITVLLSAGLASSISFSVNAQTREQYEPSRGVAEPPEAVAALEETSGSDGAPVPVSQAPKAALLPTGKPSQGSAVKGPGLPEENFPAYSQVVDNGSKGRFRAPGWGTESSGSYFYGDDYGVAGSGKGTKSAQYKVKVPATDKYTVYAWWPGGKESGSATRYGVRTTSGVRWTEVDQKRDGGLWVKLGEYTMAKGDRYAVQVAQGSGGAAVADGVAVVRGVLAGPPDDGGARLSTTATRAGGGGTGYGVVREARRYLNTPYRYATCTKSAMSCTCLTKVAVAPFGHKLGMGEYEQWRYGGSVYVRYAMLQPGDEVFFKENGRSGPITHVGIYSGNGNIVHATSYFGKVVEKPMKYITGYAGAKRFNFR